MSKSRTQKIPFSFINADTGERIQENLSLQQARALFGDDFVRIFIAIQSHWKHMKNGKGKSSKAIPIEF